MMRITNGLAIISSLILAAGCSTDDRRTEWTNRPAYADTSTSSYGTAYGTPTYSSSTTYSSSAQNDKYATQGEAAASQLMSDNDRELCYQIRQRFDATPSFSTFSPNVTITCHNGIATLSGTVPTDEDRMQLVAQCRRTPGVSSVHDQLDIGATAATGGIYVSPPNNTQPQPTSRYDEGNRIYGGDIGDVFSLHVMGLNDTDRSLAQQILEGLRTDSALPALLPVVNIDVRNGQVVLRGTVQSAQQRRAIVATVQRAAGSSNVRDELRIQPLR